MSNYNAKNYFAHGGEELVIGGKLTFLDGAQVQNFPGGGASCGNGTAPYLADSDASTVAGLKNDFNALLGVLRTAGILPSDVSVVSGQESAGETGGEAE